MQPILRDLYISFQLGWVYNILKTIQDMLCGISTLNAIQFSQSFVQNSLVYAMMAIPNLYIDGITGFQWMDQTINDFVFGIHSIFFSKGT